jgi:microcystin-dependent protein
LTQEIALGSDLLFDVVQVGSGRQFRVSAPQDVSSLVRWDIANNQLSKSKYGYSAPGVTRVFVAGQGEGSARTIVEVTTAASLLSEAIWGRIERFVDQRNTNNIAELTQAGLEVLATEGTTVTSLEVVPSSAMADGFGVDWFLGSWVTVVVNDQQIRAQVVEVPISITSSDGVLVGAVVGDATGFDWQAILAAKQSKTEKRVSALEQNAESGGSVAGTPTGVIAEFAGATAPGGYALCDGASYTTASQPALFAVIGYLFGGSGANFNVPNHAGRVGVGKAGSGTFATLGARAGDENVTLSWGQMPQHSHTGGTSTAGNHTHVVRQEYGAAGDSNAYPGNGYKAQWANWNAGTQYRTSWPVEYSGNHSHSFTTDNSGSNEAHNNLQPYIVVNFIIKM